MPRKKRIKKEVVPVIPEIIEDTLDDETIRKDVYQFMYGTPEPTKLERTLLTLKEKARNNGSSNS